MPSEYPQQLAQARQVKADAELALDVATRALADFPSEYVQELAQARQTKADAELADSTAFIILPEFGRNKDLNARRGLDHGDGSEDLNYVSCVAWGPDFKRGSVVRDVVRTIDVTPTICDLLGAPAVHARGGRMPGLLA